MTINILKKANDVKRVFAAVLAVTTLVSVAACGSDSTSASLDSNSGKTTKITVGVCPGPYGDMVEKVIGPLLKDDGFELKTKLFNDYVQPDKALASGSIQANLMQHINYLNKFTKDNNLDLTSLGQVPTLGLGIYSKKYQSIDDIEDGSTVSIAADGSNLARSLGVLEQQGLVTLKETSTPPRLPSTTSLRIRRTSRSRPLTRPSWPVPSIRSMWRSFRAISPGLRDSSQPRRLPRNSRTKA